MKLTIQALVAYFNNTQNNSISFSDFENFQYLVNTKLSEQLTFSRGTLLEKLKNFRIYKQLQEYKLAKKIATSNDNYSETETAETIKEIKHCYPNIFTIDESNHSIKLANNIKNGHLLILPKLDDNTCNILNNCVKTFNQLSSKKQTNSHR